MARAATDREVVFAERGHTWKVETEGRSITGAASYKLGFVTPNFEIIVLSRDYSSTVASMLASLHENSFSGGTSARQHCLRLSHSGPQLMDILEGVTASIGPIITSARIRAAVSTGNANATLPGDLKPIILKPSTSYVVNMLNDTAVMGDMALAFFFRPAIKLATFDEIP